jgi:hypothetical protein
MNETMNSWRECPQCHGVEILYGQPKFSPNTLFVHFIIDPSGLLVKCSNCGHTIPVV